MHYPQQRQSRLSRRHFGRLAAAGLGSLISIGIATAQSIEKIRRVAWISAGGSPRDEAKYEQLMEAKFRGLGWSYDRNLEVVIRRYRGDSALLQKQVDEVISLKCDVILAGDPLVAGVSRQASAAVPIVVQIGASMRELGLIESYARPGGNVTGLAWDQSIEIAGKYPEKLKQLVPGLTRLGILTHPSFPDVYLRAQQDAASRLGMSTIVEVVQAQADLEAAFTRLAAGGAKAVSVTASGLAYIAMKQIIDLASQYRLPDMTIFRAATELGALASYGADLVDMHVRSIEYVDKILRGAKPGELPVQQTTKYELVINRTRAKALGLSIPKAMLVAADELID